MHRLLLSLAIAAGLSLPGAAFAIDAVATAQMKAENEVPSVISNAVAKFTAIVQDDQIKYRLQFANLTGNTLFAHIHVGQFFANGAVSVFLCNNTATGPVPQSCPTGSGTITGTITAADVIGPSGQGVDPQEFAALLKAIADGVAYVNIHTDVFTGGECRGQLVQIGQVQASSPSTP
ncbi:MAG TPA: CHRD domain-containing protein [Myxococcota bacterium]|nr:CHRD domain-containing protein [Myxococcota bacterium]